MWFVDTFNSTNIWMISCFTQNLWKEKMCCGVVGACLLWKQELISVSCLVSSLNRISESSTASSAESLNPRRRSTKPTPPHLSPAPDPPPLSSLIHETQASKNTDAGPSCGSRGGFPTSRITSTSLILIHKLWCQILSCCQRNPVSVSRTRIIRNHSSLLRCLVFLFWKHRALDIFHYLTLLFDLKSRVRTSEVWDAMNTRSSCMFTQRLEGKCQSLAQNWFCFPRRVDQPHF